MVMYQMLSSQYSRLVRYCESRVLLDNHIILSASSSQQHGDMSDLLAEPYYMYGKALLGVAR